MTKGKFRPMLFVVILCIHIMALYAFWYGLNYGFGYSAWFWFIGLYTARAIGVSLGSHRLFTHGTFKCHFTTQLVLVALAGLALEGPVAKWVINHRQHHRYTERFWDPHSPSKYPSFVGFFWAHMGWLFFEVLHPEKFVEKFGIQKSQIAKWDKFIFPLAASSSFLLPWYFAGVPGLLLAGFIGVVFHWHITWSVNSVCHIFGSANEKSRISKETSKNNWLLSLVSFVGEAWHFNHHQKTDSAFLGWKWHNLDLGKWILILGKPFGLFWNIKRPSPQV